MWLPSQPQLIKDVAYIHGYIWNIIHLFIFSYKNSHWSIIADSLC